MQQRESAQAMRRLGEVGAQLAAVSHHHFAHDDCALGPNQMRDGREINQWAAQLHCTLHSPAATGSRIVSCGG
jgi:hypothetical protein